VSRKTAGEGGRKMGLIKSGIRTIQVRSKVTGIVYEMVTNTEEYGWFDVLEFHGIVKPPRPCDYEKGYSLIEGVDAIEGLRKDSDFEIVRDEWDYSQHNSVFS
jgi:hypothetical protein